MVVTAHVSHRKLLIVAYTYVKHGIRVHILSTLLPVCINKFSVQHAGVSIAVYGRLQHLFKTRALRRAGRAAAAGFFKTPPTPKFGIGAPNAAAADNLWSPPA